MAKDTTANPVTGEIELPRKHAIPDVSAKYYEVAGFVCLLVALFLLLSLVSYDGLAKDGSTIPGGNLLGVAGEWTAYIALALFGFTAYLLNLFLWIAAASLFFSRIAARMRPKTVLGMIFIGLLSLFAFTLYYMNFKAVEGVVYWAYEWIYPYLQPLVRIGIGVWIAHHILDKKSDIRIQKSEIRN